MTFPFPPYSGRDHQRAFAFRPFPFPFWGRRSLISSRPRQARDRGSFFFFPRRRGLQHQDSFSALFFFFSHHPRNSSGRAAARKRLPRLWDTFFLSSGGFRIGLVTKVSPALAACRWKLRKSRLETPPWLFLFLFSRRTRALCSKLLFGLFPFSPSLGTAFHPSSVAD